MSVLVCRSSDVMSTSEDGQEKVSHGTLSFPVACFTGARDSLCIIPHWHKNFEVLTVPSGTWTVCAGTSRLKLRAGQGLFINSGALHSMQGEPGCSGEFRSVVFSPELIGGGLGSVFWHKYIDPLAANSDLRAVLLDRSASWHAVVISLIDEAWQACADESAGYEFEVRAALSSVILHIVINTCTPPVPQPRSISRSEQRVKLMMQYVHDNYTEDLSLEEICAHAAVSQSEALRCFRDTIGTTPMRYVKEYRLTRAATLLCETDLPAGDIGAKCGFSDSAYFSKSFRAWSGMPPTEYRREHRI